VRTLHVVDDNEEDRKTIKRLIQKSWDAGEGPAERPEVQEWSFIWDLTEGEALKKTDVVIADLYSTEYWAEAPPPKPPRRPPRPKDPTNFYNATVDVVSRFLRKVPERGGTLILMTYIPNFIQRNLGVPVAADRLRELLQAQPFDFFEKEKPYGDEECVRLAVKAANEALRG
jgi:hypothetical protein